MSPGNSGLSFLWIGIELEKKSKGYVRYKYSMKLKNIEIDFFNNHYIFV